MRAGIHRLYPSSCRAKAEAGARHASMPWTSARRYSAPGAGDISLRSPAHLPARRARDRPRPPPSSWQPPWRHRSRRACLLIDDKHMRMRHAHNNIRWCDTPCQNSQATKTCCHLSRKRKMKNSNHRTINSYLKAIIDIRLRPSSGGASSWVIWVYFAVSKAQVKWHLTRRLFLAIANMQTRRRT